MNVLVVPDGFKDSLNSQQVAAAICQGVKAANANNKTHTIFASDGGDGFLKVVKHYKSNLEQINSKTIDPLGRPIVAPYLWDSVTLTAYIELAAASGIELLSPEERKVMITTTKGTGKQIKEAINKGARYIYIGLGGSATNDAALGITSELGYVFKDKNGQSLYGSGRDLEHLDAIFSPANKTNWPKFYAINDVQNPLFGANGAARVYAKQKGASPAQIEQLDKGLKITSQQVKNALGIDAADLPGAGAAGGTGYGLKVFCEASFIRGSDFILGLTPFDQLLESGKIDLIITGEGKIDQQTQSGKLISGILHRAKPYKVPVVAVCGKLGLNSSKVSELGLTRAVEIYNPKQPEGYSYTHAAQLLSQVSKELIKDFR